MNTVAHLDDAQPGPALQLLNERQRRFVIAAIEFPKRRGRWLYAAKAAGYGSQTQTSSNRSLAAIGCRLASDERIVAALEEESRKRLRALSPSAVHALERLVENDQHRDHGRAVAAIIDRADPIVTSLNLNHEHQHHVSVADIQRVRQRIAELAEKFGVPPMPAVDAEFKVVEFMTSPDEHSDFYMLPCGCYNSIVLIAMTKRWLQTETDPEHRLFLLENLDRLADPLTLTVSMIAEIDAANDVEADMFSALIALDRGHEGCPNTYKLLTSWETFEKFASVNGSYARAMRLRQREREAMARKFAPIETANRPTWDVPHVPAPLPPAARERAQIAKPGFRPW